MLYLWNNFVGNGPYTFCNPLYFSSGFAGLQVKAIMLCLQG